MKNLKEKFHSWLRVIANNLLSRRFKLIDGKIVIALIVCEYHKIVYTR